MIASLRVRPYADSTQASDLTATFEIHSGDTTMRNVVDYASDEEPQEHFEPDVPTSIKF